VAGALVATTQGWNPFQQKTPEEPDRGKPKDKPRNVVE
jgi:hypothetical protein